MYLLFTSPIPLSKEIEGELKFILQNKLLMHVPCTLKTTTTTIPTIFLIFGICIIVRNGARIKRKLMGLMVYF
jgi:hypothetical protein